MATIITPIVTSGAVQGPPQNTTGNAVSDSDLITSDLTPDKVLSDKQLYRDADNGPYPNPSIDATRPIRPQKPNNFGLGYTVPANQSVPITFAAVTRHVVVQNNSANPVFIDFDTPATPGSLQLAAGAEYIADIFCRSLYVYSATATTVNGPAAGVYVQGGW